MLIKKYTKNDAPVNYLVFYIFFINNRKFQYLLFFILFFFTVTALSHAQLILKNKYLQVKMDEHTGRFTLKTIQGHPYEKHDSDHDILDNSDWPPTTFASLKYNNEVYVIGSSAGFPFRSCITNDALLYIWKIKECSIIQKLSLQTMNSNPSLNILYDIINYSSDKINMNLRLCLDTSISRQLPVYMSPAFLKINTETNLSGPNEWFCMDSIKYPGIYLHFSIAANHSSKLKNVIFSSWDKFDKYKWDIPLNREKPFHNSYFFSKNTDDVIGVFWDNSVEAYSESRCSLNLSVKSSRIDNNSLDLSYYPGTNGQINPVYFTIENKGLQNIENILVKFHTDKTDKIFLSQAEKKINNLALFEKDIISCPYICKANIDDTILFKITAHFSYEKSFQKEIKIYNGRPALNISADTDISRNISSINFIISSSNCINPKKRYISIYNSADEIIFKDEIPAESLNSNIIHYKWDGLIKDKESISNGTYCYYTTSFSNFTGDYFVSGKGVFFYPKNR